MTGCRINKFGIFTISWLRIVCMDVKIRNKFVDNKYSVSYGLVIFITNHRCFILLEISKYRWSNGSVFKDTRKVNKFNSFIYESTFYEMPFVFVTESITGRRACWVDHLVTSAAVSVSKTRNTEIGRELQNESIECQPWSSNTLDKTLSEVFDFFSARIFRLPFPFFLIPCDLD